MIPGFVDRENMIPEGLELGVASISEDGLDLDQIDTSKVNNAYKRRP